VPHFWTAVQLPGIEEDLSNPLLKLLATLAAIAFFAFRPFVITAFGNAKQGARLRDTELEAVIMDE